MILVRSLVGCVYHLLGLLLHTVCRCEVEKGAEREEGGVGCLAISTLDGHFQSILASLMY